MRLLVIGGTGLLGFHTVAASVAEDYETASLARKTIPGFPEGPKGSVRQISSDVHAMSETELVQMLGGFDFLVYALGLDDRELQDRPAYPHFRRDLVDNCIRVIAAARAAGVKRAIVMGSYFTWFDRIRPELRLAEYHPYIRARSEQKAGVLDLNGNGFETMLLEVPYVFGLSPGRVPGWAFLIDRLRGKGSKAFFPLSGGTAAVTAAQVGKAAIGALKHGSGGASFPLGGINIGWKDLAERILSHVPVKKTLIHIPPILFRIAGRIMTISAAIRGKERGLDIVRYANLQYSEAYIDPDIAMNVLGYEHDDYDAALGETVRSWLGGPGGNRA